MASTLLNQLKTMLGYASTGQGANYMSRGFRLEVQVNALDMETAFNLAIHKMRTLLAHELDIITVRLAEYIEGAQAALDQCRAHVHTKHINRTLTPEQVLAGYTYICTWPCVVGCAFGHVWLGRPRLATCG